MHLNLVARLVVIWTLVACALAFPSPTTPVADTEWNVGDNVEIRWIESGKAPRTDTLSGINIYFMTGPNIGQIKLATIVENLDSNATSASWTVPPLTDFGFPAGNIYFIMFTDSQDPDFGISWSTRFKVLDGSPEVDYNPDDPWPYGQGNSSEPSGNQTDPEDPTNDDPDASDDDTPTGDSEKDDNKNSTDGGTTTIRTGPTPTPPPSNNGNNNVNSGNTVPRFIPAVTFVTGLVIAAAAFLA